MGCSVLLVAVRGWTTSGELLLKPLGRPGSEFREDFVKSLEAELHDTEIWAPDLDLGMFSMRSPESLSDELFEKIDRKVAANPSIKSIVILGYSTGSLLARRVFCRAHGADTAGNICSKRVAPWAQQIDRLVMLAAITRGWELSSASPALVRFLAPILQWVTLAVGWIKKITGRAEWSSSPLIWQMRRGSSFVVSSRIQYINVLESLLTHRAPTLDGDEEPRQNGKNNRASPLRVDGLPSTVFLLGSMDEYVSPADCTELGPRIEFAFIELPGSNHLEATQISGDGARAKERRARLTAAIASDFSSLKGESWTVPAVDIDDYLDPMDIAVRTGGQATHGRDLSTLAPVRVLRARDSASDAVVVTHAVMIVHGIRDNGFWTKRVAREIKTLARTQRIEVRAPTPSYGYFSMRDFICGREHATRWFLERYADVKSHFPCAKISFVGHSNGTYIAARALELCPAVKFENIVFAGSVVRRDFRWARFPKRVRAILNYVGSGDGVVAFLPAVFEFLHLRWLDVGGAGAFGFKEAEPLPAISKPLIDPPTDNISFSDDNTTLSEFRFVAGGHGAAIAEEFWPEIAQFVLLGTTPKRQPVKRKRWLQFLFRCAPALTSAVAILVAILILMPLIATAVLARVQNLSGIQTVCILIAVSVGIFVSLVCGRVLRMW
jgi:pimeloyl-ACP methyl ester carboxylesterase